MARSFRRIPFFSITGALSEKENKRQANRDFRRKTRLRAKSGTGGFLLLREISNVWAFNKDGKYYRKGVKKKDMRK